MMETMLYPTQFAPVAEEEMTYISGGADLAAGGLVVGAVILGLAAAGCAVSVLSTSSLQKEYEEKYGIAAIDPNTHLYTSDFQNYRQRAVSQGRNDAAEFASNLTNTLVMPFAAVAAAGLLVVTIYLANAK